MSLARIAVALNLSVTTVSRALGGFGDVSAKTRAKVEAEARRIGYKPNVHARRLKGGRSDAVAIVLPTGPGQLDDPFFLRLIGALGPRLAAAGLDLIVSSAEPGDDELALYRQLVENGRVDAMFVARTRRRDARIDYLIDRRLPFVVHGRTERGDHAFVDVDGAAAFREATERLLVFGHRRIAFVGVPLDYSFGFHREAGWRGAMIAAGLAPDTACFAAATEENGFRLAREVLALPERPTAILCATDRLAIGALHAVGAEGLVAGRDVSVVGYDDSPAGRYASTPLTTFDPHVEATARHMVAMLLAQLGGTKGAGLSEIFRAELVVRQSDGPAPLGAIANGPHKSRSQSRENASDDEGLRIRD